MSMWFSVLGMVLDLILGVGEVVRPPAMRAEPTYEVKVEDNNILIKNKR
jgi:hypothetical protein